MEKNTGTIFKIYLFAKQTKPGKQEGVLQLWKHRGAIQKHKGVQFDYFDELPRKIRKLLSEYQVEWPLNEPRVRRNTRAKAHARSNDISPRPGAGD